MIVKVTLHVLLQKSIELLQVALHIGLVAAPFAEARILAGLNRAMIVKLDRVSSLAALYYEARNLLLFELVNIRHVALQVYPLAETFAKVLMVVGLDRATNLP